MNKNTKKLTTKKLYVEINEILTTVFFYIKIKKSPLSITRPNKPQ